MTIAQSLLPEVDSEMESTRRVLTAAPFDRFDWKPHTKSMSLGRLAGHLAEMPEWGSSVLNLDQLALTSESYKPSEPKSLDELTVRFDKDRDAFRATLADTSDDAMNRIWSMLWDGQKVVEMPKINVIRIWMMNHMIHHRGQLTVYLRLLNIPVPGVYGPSADEM
jgi:uncharacterized damage-inducible protein DinB